MGFDMAQLPEITLSEELQVVFRAADPELQRLRDLVFRRYPHKEWATFIRCGWRVTPSGLVLTLASVDPPGTGDMEERVGNVLIRDPYSLRIAQAARSHPLAVGLVHSHPAGFAPCPSTLDDDMDSYYGERYLRGFAPGRPFVSLIMALHEGELVVSGRVFWNQEWHAIQRILLERTPNRTWVDGRRPHDDPPNPRTERLSSAFGLEAAARLRRSTVAVIGAGGTGSAAVEVLARAGVGRLIVVDPDVFEESNLERVHGSLPEHITKGTPKVVIALEHVRAIAPGCEVLALKGSLPQAGVVDALLSADVVVGCTDTQHSRLALSDLAARYLVPSIDVGVALAGADGTVTAQVAQFRRCLASDPCMRCRGMISQWRLNQELMSLEERRQRREDADAARLRGEDPTAYWRDEPQLNTVGYLTTAAGSLAAGYAIGWITGRFEPRFTTLEASLLVPSLAVIREEPLNSECHCTMARGWADQGARYSLITAAPHWPPVERL